MCKLLMNIGGEIGNLLHRKWKLIILAVVISLETVWNSAPQIVQD